MSDESIGPALAPEPAPLLRAPPEPWPRLRLDVSQSSHVVAAVLFGVTVLYVFGLPLLFLVQSLRAGGAPDPAITPRALVFSLLMNLAVMGLGAVGVLALVAPDRAALRRNLFVEGGLPAGKAFAFGAVVTVAAMMLYGLALAALDRFVAFGENDVVAELGEELTWPLVLFVALASGISEELYFRALLAPRLGIVASSLLFGLVHVTYGNWLQVVVPAVLGLVFGWLLWRTRSIVAPMAGHVVWNFIQLAGAMYVADHPDLMARLFPVP